MNSGRRWCDHWWTTSIKPRLLFSLSKLCCIRNIHFLRFLFLNERQGFPCFVLTTFATWLSAGRVRKHLTQTQTGVGVNKTGTAQGVCVPTLLGPAHTRTHACNRKYFITWDYFFPCIHPIEFDGSVSQHSSAHTPVHSTCICLYYTPLKVFFIMCIVSATYFVVCCVCFITLAGHYTKYLLYYI